MAKKKRLPKDFEDMLKEGDLPKLKAVFDTCDVNARGSMWKKTALAFDECPDELACWLVERGADLSAGNEYGETPLHSRAASCDGRIGILLELGSDVNHGEGGRGTPLHMAVDSGNDENTELLLAHGARVDALNDDAFTPLEYGLYRCRNSGIEQMAKLAELLLQAGARKTPMAVDCVQKIGTDFEFHRKGFHPEHVEATSAALDRLYSLFEVQPVPRRAMHDGKSPIVVTATSATDRHQALWELLVPSSGAAEIVQGEVIRISGRIANELDGNGGVNWDARFRKMADCWLAHVSSGKPLPTAEMNEAQQIVSDVKRRSGDTARMCELSVAWVLLNPKPVELPPPPYDR